MTEEIQSHEQADLRGRVARSVGWTLAAQATTQVLALTTSIVVARLLGPFDVGIAAMALVFGTLAVIVADFGLGAAIIQRPELTEADRSTAFWASVAIGVALALSGVALSWPIAELYGEPRVQPLFAVLSIAFLFTALGVVQGALLVRDLRFRSLQIRTIVATFASCATAIALAAAGAGPWAVIAQDLVITGVSTALLWRASTWRPQATFSFERLRDMAGYSTRVFATQALTWANVTVDNLLIGRYLGPAPLGSYTIAYSLMTTPLKRIATPLTGVFFPAFSAMRDRDRIAVVWLRATRMLAAVVVPVTLGMIPAAPALVAAVFGPEWTQSIPLIQILAAVGLVTSLVALNDGVLAALARTRLLFRYWLAFSTTSIAAFALALELGGGVEGVAWAVLAVTLALHPVFVVLTARALEVSALAWVRSVAGVLEAGLVMMAAVFALRDLALPDDLAPGLELGVLVAVGAAVYLPMVLWRAPEVMAEVRALRERRSRAGAS